MNEYICVNDTFKNCPTATASSSSRLLPVPLPPFKLKSENSK